MLRHVRRLPHWDAIGQPQFVTFRLHGSLPATPGFRREHVATSGEAFVTMDRLLDKGATGPLYLKRPDVAALVVEALLDSDVRFKRCKLQLARWESVTARFGRTKVTILRRSQRSVELNPVKAGCVQRP